MMQRFTAVGPARAEAKLRAPSYSVHFMLCGVSDDRHELIHGVAPPSSEDDRIV